MLTGEKIKGSWMLALNSEFPLCFAWLFFVCDTWQFLLPSYTGHALWSSFLSWWNLCPLDSTFSVHSFYKVHGLSGLSELLLFMSPNSKKKNSNLYPPIYAIYLFKWCTCVITAVYEIIASHVLKTEFKGCDEDSKGLKMYILLAVQKNILLSVKNTYILKSTSLRHSLYTIKHLFCVQLDTMASQTVRVQNTHNPSKVPSQSQMPATSDVLSVNPG